jgi:ankyrin repeat protein
MYGVHACHKAAAKGHSGIIQLLYLHKADIDCKDHSAETPLHFAARAGEGKCLAKLIDFKADVRAKDRDFFQPLHYAAYYGHTHCIDRLISCKAHVDAKNRNSCTALHQAVANGQHASVDVLLANNADIHITDAMGETALFWAARRGYHDILLRLIEHNAQIDAKDAHSNTIVHVAARAGQWHTIELILELQHPILQNIPAHSIKALNVEKGNASLGDRATLHDYSKEWVNWMTFQKDVKGDTCLDIASKAQLIVPEPSNVQLPTAQAIAQLQEKATEEAPFVMPPIKYFPSPKESFKVIERSIQLLQGYIWVRKHVSIVVDCFSNYLLSSSTFKFDMEYVVILLAFRCISYRQVLLFFFLFFVLLDSLCFYSYGNVCKSIDYSSSLALLLNWSLH